MASVAVSAPNVGAAQGGDPSKRVDLRGVTVEPMPAGGGIPQRSATVPDVTEPLPAGYEESEYLIDGKAAIYSGPATGPVTVESSDHAFATRVLVRAPANPSDFSGTVWIEPFNTSGGGDADAVWSTIAPLVEQRGDAWVGVTVRASSVPKLQEFDPVRYAGLDFADNAYAWDALRYVGTTVKANAPESPLDGYRVKNVYLGGYSQSGVDVATFVGAFNRMTRLRSGAPVYDGYLVGAHDGNLSPLESGGSVIPKFEAAKIPAVDSHVVDIEPQTDVEGFAVEVPTALARDAGLAGAEDIQTPTFTYVNPGGATVRKADSNKKKDRYWLFEIPGAPHATGSVDDGCDGSSSFPTKNFTRAAAASLARWVEKGMAPPHAPRIKLATQDDVSVAEIDEHGNALGGVRSPFVDVPLARYDVHSGPAPTCKQVGVETTLSADVLERLYGDAQGYMEAFTKSLDATIKAGFLLELDRQAILDAQELRANEVFATVSAAGG
jgi:hypothetical protein